MARRLKGTTVPGFKNTLGSKSVEMPVPETVKIPMLQHLGVFCDPLVKRNDHVKVGQKIGECDARITAPVHSSVSGTVKSIQEQFLAGGQKSRVVVIETDGEQTLAEGIAPPVVNSHKDLVEAVKESGIVGLGGAGFPTHVKLNPSNLNEIHTLIINAAECEPYITSDNQAILEDSEFLLKGIESLIKWLEVSNCYIAIEEDKPKAIEKLKEVTASNDKIQVKVLPSIYPQGAEKITIYHTTDGIVVPEGKLPADVGVLVVNVSTTIEIAKYLETGIPLVSRRITVDGSAVKNPGNIIAPVGTAIKDIIEFCGGYKEEPAKILFGGPMMGVAIPNDEFSLIKQNNALIALGKKEATYYAETPCISCGRCVRACPMNLMPSFLKEATTVKDVETLEKLKVNLCMECGCCSYVCPAKQELVQSHRRGKAMVKESLED